MGRRVGFLRLKVELVTDPGLRFALSVASGGCPV